MSDELWEQAKKLAAEDYDVDTFRDTLTDGSVVIVAKHPELPGCTAHGATRDEAIENLKEARLEYIYSLLEDGLQVPYPRHIATSTDVNTENAGFETIEVTGFGLSAHDAADAEDQEEDWSFSYRGDVAS